MTDIRITAGSFGEGPGAYDDGTFRMPDGEIRGVEDLATLELPDDSGTEPHWGGDIVRGLKGALATSSRGLPRPFGFAASLVGAGLGALDPSGRPAVTLVVTFADGAGATIATDAALAATIARDREVVRLAALRRDAAEPAAPPPEPGSGDADPTLTSMFQYEKRKGRLRRVPSAKESGKG